MTARLHFTRVRHDERFGKAGKGSWNLLETILLGRANLADRANKKLPHPLFKMRQRCFDDLKFYQTWQAFWLTIFWPGLQPKALAKSELFCNVPLVRYSPGECGSVLASSNELSGVEFWHHTWAKPRKKRCSGVNPYFSGATF